MYVFFIIVFALLLASLFCTTAVLHAHIMGPIIAFLSMQIDMAMLTPILRM